MSELQPCPFCGSNDIEVKQYYNDGWYWFVTCKNCKAEKIHQFKGVAIQEWNTRYADDALRAEVKRMKIELRKLWYEFRDRRHRPFINHNEYRFYFTVEGKIESLLANGNDAPTNAPDTNVGTMEGE